MFLCPIGVRRRQDHSAEFAELQGQFGPLSRPFAACATLTPSAVTLAHIDVDFADLNDDAVRSAIHPYRYGDTAVQDAEGLLKDLVDLEGLAAGIPVALTAPIETWKVVFTGRRSTEIYVELTRLEGGASEAWALRQITYRPAQRCALGRGYATGPAAIIHTGTVLIRAQHSDGAPLDTPLESAQKRCEATQRTSVELFLG